MSFANSPTPARFFEQLNWVNGTPLSITIDPYRRRILDAVLYTFEGGRPKYNFALCGRGKKNYKTTDLILAVLYRFLAWESPKGNDCFVLANDEDQAADDLKLAKAILQASPEVAADVRFYDKEIVRTDGMGVLRILPAKDAAGAHGKTFSICAFDEIHGYKNHDIFEALAHDPTRHDALTWITSYASLKNTPGIPLFDFMRLGRSAEDPQMFFSWYSGDFTTDPDFAKGTPEERANPSMASWGPGDTGRRYLETEKRRLPLSKYRRLHLNLAGAPEGAALDADKIEASLVARRVRIAPEAIAEMSPRPKLFAYVDMSGGGEDDAVLAIAYKDKERGKSVLASIMRQDGRQTPRPKGEKFNPRDAVKRFATEMEAYHLSQVTGDSYAGNTFKADFKEHGISLLPRSASKSANYEAFEPMLNADEVELLDHARLKEQLIGLVWRGTKIDHQDGDHDDHADAAVGALLLAGSQNSVPWFQSASAGIKAATEAMNRSALGGGSPYGRFNSSRYPSYPSGRRH